MKKYLSKKESQQIREQLFEMGKSAYKALKNENKLRDFEARDDLFVTLANSIYDLHLHIEDNDGNNADDILQMYVEDGYFLMYWSNKGELYEDRVLSYKWHLMDLEEGFDNNEFKAYFVA